MSRTRQLNLLSLSTFNTVFFSTLFFAILFIFGALTAIAPQLMIRVAPALLIPLVIIIAALGRNDLEPNQKLCSAWLTMLILIYSLWPTYLMFKAGGLPAIEGRRIAALFSILALAYLIINKSPVRRHLTGDSDAPTKIVSIIILTYMILRIASCFVSPYPATGLLLVAWDFIYYYGMYYVAIGYFGNEKSSTKLSSMLLWSTLFVGVFVVLEKKTGVNVLSMYAPQGGALDEVSAMQSISRDRDGQFRAQGTFEHPITLSEFSSIASCFSLSILLWPGKIFIKILSGISLAICMFMIFASGSRSGFVCAGIGMALVFVLWIYRARRIQNKAGIFIKQILVISTIAIALMAAAPVIWLLTQGRSTNEQLSSQARTEMLQRGIPSVIDNPFIGTGIGSAGPIAGHIGNKGIITLDNQYLGIAIESGVPALLLFIFSLLIPAARASLAILSRPSLHSAFLAGGVGTMVVLLVIHGTMWLSTNLTFGYLIAGLMMVFSRQELGLPKTTISSKEHF